KARAIIVTLTAEATLDVRGGHLGLTEEHRRGHPRLSRGSPPPSGGPQCPPPGRQQIRLRGDDTRAPTVEPVQATQDASRPNERTVMICKGDKLENPVTGEVLIFHLTSKETDGEAVMFETIVRPGGCVAAAHVHPFQTERFEVLEGQLALRRGDEELTVEPG